MSANFSRDRHSSQQYSQYLRRFAHKDFPLQNRNRDPRCGANLRLRAESQAFPVGARLYDWNTLPMATVPGTKGRTILNYIVEAPREVTCNTGLHNAWEVCRKTFEALRAMNRKLFRAAA